MSGVCVMRWMMIVDLVCRFFVMLKDVVLVEVMCIRMSQVSVMIIVVMALGRMLWRMVMIGVVDVMRWMVIVDWFSIFFVLLKVVVMIVVLRGRDVPVGSRPPSRLS